MKIHRWKDREGREWRRVGNITFAVYISPDLGLSAYELAEYVVSQL